MVGLALLTQTKHKAKLKENIQYLFSFSVAWNININNSIKFHQFLFLMYYINIEFIELY